MNCSIVSVDMDVVGVMVAYLPVVRVCTVYTVHTRTTGKYAASTQYTNAPRVRICCHNTDYVHGHDRTITAMLAKHCIKLPDDGSLVIRNMLEQF